MSAAAAGVCMVEERRGAARAGGEVTEVGAAGPDSEPRGPRAEEAVGEGSAEEGENRELGRAAAGDAFLSVTDQEAGRVRVLALEGLRVVVPVTASSFLGLVGEGLGISFLGSSFLGSSLLGLTGEGARGMGGLLLEPRGSGCFRKLKLGFRLPLESSGANLVPKVLKGSLGSARAASKASLRFKRSSVVLVPLIGATSRFTTLLTICVAAVLVRGGAAAGAALPLDASLTEEVFAVSGEVNDRGRSEEAVDFDGVDLGGSTLTADRPGTFSTVFAGSFSGVFSDAFSGAFSGFSALSS